MSAIIKIELNTPTKPSRGLWLKQNMGWKKSLLISFSISIIGFILIGTMRNPALDFMGMALVLLFPVFIFLFWRYPLKEIIKMRKLLYVLGGIILLFGVMGIAGDMNKVKKEMPSEIRTPPKTTQPLTETQEALEQPEQQPQPKEKLPIEKPEPVKVIFNIPVLAQKSFPELKQLLGTPVNDTPPTIMKEGTSYVSANGHANWEKENLLMTVYYDKNGELPDMGDTTPLDICAINVFSKGWMDTLSKGEPPLEKDYLSETELRQASNLTETTYPFQIKLVRDRLFSDGRVYGLRICLIKPDYEKPISEKNWQSVKSWTGSGAKKTEPFTISGDRWRINWSASDFIQVFVYRPGSDAIEEVAVNSFDGGEDTYYIYNKSGEFYLHINPMGSWTIEVEELE